MSGLGAIIDTGRRLADRALADGTATGWRHAGEWRKADEAADRLRAALDHLVATRNALLDATSAWEDLDEDSRSEHWAHAPERERQYALGRWNSARKRMDEASDRWLAACVAASIAAGAKG